MERSSLLVTIRRVGNTNRVALRNLHLNDELHTGGVVVHEDAVEVSDERLRALHTACERLVHTSHLHRVGEQRASADPPASSRQMIPSADGIEDVRSLGAQLYAYLFPESLQGQLRQCPTANLFLELDEKLVHLPWELCYDGQDFLATKFRIGRHVVSPRAPRLREDTNSRGFNLPLRVLIIADPTENLPSAAQEGRELKAMLSRVPALKVNLIGGAVVTSGRLPSTLAKYDIVHYAGHSVYDAVTPGKSGWLLSDGMLTAEDLRKLQRPPVLVFSNSCQAGATAPWENEEQAFGLGSTFIESGVKRYIGTFWSVYDETSLRFAATFYRHLVVGATIGDALQYARQAVTPQPGWYELAGLSYMLYGSPNARLWQEKSKNQADDEAIDTVIGPDIDKGRPLSRAYDPPVVREHSSLHVSIRRYAGVLLLSLAMLAGAMTLLLRPQPPVEPFTVEASKLVSGIASPLRDGDVLTESDRYVITVTLTQALFLYAFQQDSMKNVIPLYPDPGELSEAALPPGTHVRIPAGEDGRRVRPPAGQEVLIVLGSTERLKGLDAQLKALSPEGERVRGSERVPLSALEAALLRTELPRKTIVVKNAATSSPQPKEK